VVALFSCHSRAKRRIPDPALRNASQILEKWSDMVLCCWGFYENVSRETFLSSGDRITNNGLHIGRILPNPLDRVRRGCYV
jgi:hypothetical protein